MIGSLAFSWDAFLSHHVDFNRRTLSNHRPECVGEQEASGIVFRIGSWSRKDLPEPECFVTSTCDYCGSIGRHGQVQDSVGVTRQCNDLAKARIPPHHDLIQGVTVCAHDLVAVLRPSEVAHLAARINTVQCRTTQRIPEPDTSICCSTSAG